MTKYISAAQLAERYSVDRSTVWRWTSDGKLPAPIKLSDQVTRWNLDDIEASERDRTA